MTELRGVHATVCTLSYALNLGVKAIFIDLFQVGKRSLETGTNEPKEIECRTTSSGPLLRMATAYRSGTLMKLSVQILDLPGHVWIRFVQVTWPK